MVPKNATKLKIHLNNGGEFNSVYIHIFLVLKFHLYQFKADSGVLSTWVKYF